MIEWRHRVSVWTVQELILQKSSLLTEIGKGYEFWELDSLELNRLIRTWGIRKQNLHLSTSFLDCGYAVLSNWLYFTESQLPCWLLGMTVVLIWSSMKIMFMKLWNSTAWHIGRHTVNVIVPENEWNQGQGCLGETKYSWCLLASGKSLRTAAIFLSWLILTNLFKKQQEAKTWTRRW